MQIFDPFLHLLQSNFPFLLAFVLAISLCVGSFLNVVAWRLPLRIEQDFRLACFESFGVPPGTDQERPVSLLRPSSECPICRTAIKPWHNIPVLGWLILRGRCAACGVGISLQYPVVEAVTGIASGYCVWHFGYSPQLPAALGITWSLLALAVIDLKALVLPDEITLPLLWSGLVASLFGVFITPAEAIVGAAVGYGSLWMIYQAYRVLTNKEGMGYGDFKLLGALGAWFGWQSLPLTLMVSALGVVVVALLRIAARTGELGGRIPFGPYIAAAGWIGMFWGADINLWYMSISGMM